jgi:hypothetical protein
MVSIEESHQMMIETVAVSLSTIEMCPSNDCVNSRQRIYPNLKVNIARPDLLQQLSQSHRPIIDAGP